MQINWAIAWNATHNLVVSIGVIALFCFIVTLKPFFMVIALLFLIGFWYVLYRIELGYRTRRLREFRY